MANPEHLAIFLQGVDAWNEWQRVNRASDHPIVADLSELEVYDGGLRGIDLSDTELLRAKFRDADLSGADLSGAGLTEADLSGARLIGTDLRWANLAGTILEGANLKYAKLQEARLYSAALVKTNLDYANLTGCYVYGISAWDVSLVGTIQNKIVITPPGEPIIQVDDLEVAQFIYLLLNRQKLRNVITTLGEKGVLILGRFTERKDLLEGMAAKLREFGYLPIIFDFERPTNLDITETVKILAGLSAFVIADITNPLSVPLELQATVPD